MVERREILKGIGVAAAAAAAATEEATAQASAALGPVASPWDPADPNIPGRFAGTTIIVTGSACGTGEVAARRLAKEGANVVVSTSLRNSAPR